MTSARNDICNVTGHGRDRTPEVTPNTTTRESKKHQYLDQRDPGLIWCAKFVSLDSANGICKRLQIKTPALDWFPIESVRQDKNLLYENPNTQYLGVMEL